VYNCLNAIKNLYNNVKWHRLVSRKCLLSTSCTINRGMRGDNICHFSYHRCQSEAYVIHIMYVYVARFMFYSVWFVIFGVSAEWCTQYVVNGKEIYPITKQVNPFLAMRRNHKRNISNLYCQVHQSRYFRMEKELDCSENWL
jgi:hypothetical protein